MMREFAGLGGYFSFNAYFLHERKEKQREVFREVPEERLLVETDAPAMCPPEERDRYRLGKDLNHPGNVAVAYEGLAEIRGVEVEELARRVEGNFGRLFR
jgi:TatD DNase family protein